MTTKPLLGITMGDPNGIGPEIIAKLLGDTAFKPKARALVIGDAGCIERSLQKLRIQRAVRRLASAVELPPEEPECIDVLDLKNVDEHAQRMGTVQPAAGHAAHEALIMAADLALAGQIDAIVTAPLNKEALHLAGIQEPGHTEILAARAGVRNVTMMLVAGAFRVTHVSTHCSLREAIERVQVARIQTVIELTHCTVHQLGNRSPPPCRCRPESARWRGWPVWRRRTTRDSAGHRRGTRCRHRCRPAATAARHSLSPNARPGPL